MPRSREGGFSEASYPHQDLTHEIIAVYQALGALDSWRKCISALWSWNWDDEDLHAGAKCPSSSHTKALKSECIART